MKKQIIVLILILALLVSCTGQKASIKTKSLLSKELKPLPEIDKDINQFVNVSSAIIDNPFPNSPKTF